MKIYGVNPLILEVALSKTNEEFNNNIQFKKYPSLISRRNEGYILTLKVKDTAGAGARRSVNGRRLPSACWHVHGTFYDHIFDMSSNVKIVTAISTMTDSSHNWHNVNIGSKNEPFMMMEACDC